jgi:hypothetical protein
LNRLSQQISQVQQVIKDQLGISTVYIVGGSSRAVLDTIYGSKPLQMRDLDLFATAGGRATRGKVRQLADAMSRFGFQAKAPERRPRGNPALGRAGINYNAGFGVFLRRPRGNGPYLDLTLLHDERALRLNGPLNIDRIRIPIHHGETLESVVKQMRGLTYDQAVARGMVVDESGGFRSWRTGSPRMTNWGDVWSDVERMKPRLVKSYLKAGARMPPELVDKVRLLPQLRRRQPHLERRYTRRVLSLPLPQAIDGLRLLRRLDAAVLQDQQLRRDPLYQSVSRAERALRPAGRRGARRGLAPRKTTVGYRHASSSRQ